MCYLTANTHYDAGALIPECNSLSQLKEDTGELFIPVRAFNLTPGLCPWTLLRDYTAL